MQSIWLSLLWKEWREYRWKLLALTLALLVPLTVTTIKLNGHGVSELIEVTFAFLCCYGFLAGMFLGMGLAGRENGAGTEQFLRTLPTPMWKTATAKLIVASLTATIPIGVFLSLAYLSYRTEVFYLDDLRVFRIGDGRFLQWDAVIAYWFPRCFLVTAFSTVSLLWWMAALGANRSDEIRAGAIGFLGVAAIWFCLGYLLHLADKHRLSWMEAGVAQIASAAPGGPLFWQAFSSNSRPGIPKLDQPLPLFAFIGHAAVALSFLYRYGRSELRTGKGDGSRSLPVLAKGLRQPFRSQLSALVWKQARETGPLALVALAAVLTMASVGWWVDKTQSVSFSEIFLGVGGVMSFLVVVVAGVGLYLEESKPDISQFWRSRPIHLGAYFSVKYLISAAVLVVFLGVPILIASAVYWNRISAEPWHELAAGFLFMAWIFVMAYSLAMTLQYLCRQPIYAAIFSPLAIWVGAIGFFWVFRDSHWSIVAATMVCSLMATITLGWLAVKNDWGWKR